MTKTSGFVLVTPETHDKPKIAKNSGLVIYPTDSFDGIKIYKGSLSIFSRLKMGRGPQRLLLLLIRVRETCITAIVPTFKI